MAASWLRISRGTLRGSTASTSLVRIFLSASTSRLCAPACVGSVSQKRYHSHERSHETNFDWRIPLAASLGLGGACYLRSLFANDSVQAAEKSAEEGDPMPSLPSYTMEEVGEHGTKENRIWVTYRQGVYDVTDFVDKHPGGDNIMLAAGGSTDPFWNLYAVHKEPHVQKMMAHYRIGNISEEEHRSQLVGLDDPFANEPKRHTALIRASKTPFNAETPTEVLGEQFITPTELFYVRNHLPVPDIAEEDYELELEGLGVDKRILFKLADLKKLPKTKITATIQCAGNRRSEMHAVKNVRGLEWRAGAIGNAEWTGVRLRDFLKAAGVDVEKTQAKHVQFEGADLDPTGRTYGASIPASRAFDPNSDVLLAYEMNGEPLSRDHGFPVRVLVPGVVAARSVKWLQRIVVSDEESQAFWQQNDYKGFSPSQEAEGADFTKAVAIQEMPVTSAFTAPKNGCKVRVKDGKIGVKGYAWSGGGRPIIRVDVSADGGKSWTTADLERDDKCVDSYSGCWAWTLWSASVPVPEEVREAELIVKAVDSSYNTQPESAKNIWNFRGVVTNPYHKVSVKLA